MKIVTMLRDVIQAMVTKPVTTPYPNPEPQPSRRLRGKLHWDPTHCTGCQVCVKDCPSSAITLITIDKANKQFVMNYDIARCTFCAQCVENCRFACLSMADDEWSLAVDDANALSLYYGEEEHVRKILAEFTERDTS